MTEDSVITYTYPAQQNVAIVRHDYARFLTEYGFTEEQVRLLVENQSDQVEWPNVYERLELLPSSIDGLGLFARQDFAQGDFLALARIDGKRTAAGRYTNHSPYPNASFVRTNNGDMEMFAESTIPAGTEVTVDYRQAGQVNGNNVQPIMAEVESTRRQKIEACEAEMRRYPQLDAPLKHYFTNGVYARELTIPKGALLTGKIHKYEQLNILSKGEITVTTDDGPIRVRAPFTIISPPGTKRMAYAWEECVWTTIHGTFGLKLAEGDLDQIEDAFIAQSDAEYVEFTRALALEGATS